MHGRTWTICFALLAGCGELPDPVKPAGDEGACVGCAQAFDPATTGTIKGRVTWDGAVPRAESIVATAIAYHPHLHKNPVRYETTHVPRVHSENHGVADAVVFLRGIDPRRARPWEHAAVHIDFRERRLLIQQGPQPTSVGFVRRGDKVTTVSHDADYHALRGRGSAFFTLPLITPEQPAEVRLKETGVVELFDAAGYYWVHAHLFVAEHPYYARTDADGNFALGRCPRGRMRSSAGCRTGTWCARTAIRKRRWLPGRCGRRRWKADRPSKCKPELPRSWRFACRRRCLSE